MTRAFNRLVLFNPVTVIFRQGRFLSIATCERSSYKQQWREGEQLGKVCILKNVDCEHPHRGHIDILNMINDKQYESFDALYVNWKRVFSNELLTNKFYNELFDFEKNEFHIQQVTVGLLMKTQVYISLIIQRQKMMIGKISKQR